jgi:opacity protein-like surface antigen
MRYESGHKPGMRTLALTLISAALLIAPTVAEAATWRGKTGQGRLAEVTTGADGVVASVRIRYRVRCNDGKGFRAGVRFRPPLDVATTTAVRDSGPLTWRIEGGERARGRTSVAGGLRQSGRWTGSFRVRVRITKNGRYVATCRTGRIGWRASPV